MAAGTLAGQVLTPAGNQVDLRSQVGAIQVPRTPTPPLIPTCYNLSQGGTKP